MGDERFSNREIDLKFEVIKNLLQQIAEELKQSNINTEKRFKQIEEELADIRSDVEDLKTFKTKALVYWGLFVTALSVAINKFL